MTENNMSLPLCIDGGNVFCKVIFGKRELIFPHAIAQLTREQWDYAVDAFGKAAPTDFIRLGDRFYVVGDTAENYTFTRQIGRPKYTRDYYGLLFASAVGRIFAEQPALLDQGLLVFASYPTDDFEFRKFLVRSVKGHWAFESGGNEFEFDVPSVKTYEESYGGYLRRATHYDGKTWTAPLRGRDVGVIDIGGGTCGVLAVNQNGDRQPAMSKTGTQGVQNAIDRLRQSLSRRYANLFSQTATIPEKRLRYALQTGMYHGFGEELDCQKEAELAVNPLLNEIQALWRRYLGGGAGLDNVILTGGGNGFLYERVMAAIGRNADSGVLMAESNLEEIQFANVRGARDYLDAIETAGL